MTNRERYALPAAPAPEMEIEPYTVIPYQRWDGSKAEEKRINRRYGARVVEGMLEITGYTYDGIPLWRTWQDEDRVLGQTLSDPPVVSRSTVGSRMREWSGNWYTDAGSEAVIREWLHDRFSPNLLGMIKDSQTRIRHKKRDERWDRIRAEIDNRMLEIREPTKDMMRWVRNTVFGDSHYIIYRYRKGGGETGGFCTFCGHEVTVKDPRNRASGICPRCRRPITCLSEGTLERTRQVRAEKQVCYLQSTREGFCRREFRAVMMMTGQNYKRLEPSMMELRRTFFSFREGFRDAFYWGEFETSGQLRWCRGRLPDDMRGAVYPGNLKGLFSSGEWLYIPMEQIAARCQKLRFSRVPHQMADPAVEHLAKHRLWNLAQDTINGEFHPPESCRSIREVMGLDMPSIRMLAELNVTGRQLKLFRIMEEARGKRPGKEELQTALRMGLEGRSNTVKTILKRVTIAKAEKYLLRQRGQYPQRCEYDPGLRRYRDRNWTVAEVASEWADYIEEAEGLDWDLGDDFILFPKSLKEAHQRSTEAKRIQGEKKKIERANKKLKRQKALAMRGKQWMIRPPATGEEVIREGIALRHCVGRYLGRIAEGVSIILFIRAVEEPEKSAYTLELDPETFAVRQVRGQNNSAPPKEVMEFVERWKKHLERLGGPGLLNARSEHETIITGKAG